MPSDEISKKALDDMLVGDDTEASAVVHSAIEEFAQELAHVTRRFLRTKAWAKTETIVVGGGFRDSRLGELAIARTEIILHSEDFKVDMVPIRFHPDEAALIGALHLAPSWIFEAHDSHPRGRHRRHQHSLRRGRDALEEGAGPVEGRGLEIRAVAPCRRRADPRRRGQAAGEDAEASDRAADEEGFKLAPFIGIACPGVINEDGSIEKGAQNLPGNWESSKFNLPHSLVEAIPVIGDHDTAIVMHNDGVVQGLAEVPFMQDVDRWGVLTIGTGLGNARFTNRKRDNGKSERRTATRTRRARIDVVRHCARPARSLTLSPCGRGWRAWR